MLGKKVVWALSACLAILASFDAGAAEVSSARAAKSRVEQNKIRRNHSFTELGDEYTDFKNKLAKDYGIEYSVDVSTMLQRGAPGGKDESYQTIVFPTIAWTTFKNEYGTGTINASYTAVRYGGISGSRLGSNIGVATAVNDFPTASNSFPELNYEYQFPGQMDWLTVALGQFPVYNFDGTAYDSNQQVNFVNYALSQNATSTYPVAGLGSFMQLNPSQEWSFTAGAQDATNVSGKSVNFDGLKDEKYLTFGSVSYSPNLKSWGDGQYAALLYNQPGVKAQKETTNGWSFNAMQNLGDKLAVFGRYNGVSGSVNIISHSWVGGTVYNNPLERNPLDQIGVAFAYNKVDKKVAGSTHNDDEKIVEAYWAWGVSKWMTLTPDVQFYIDPALNPKSDFDTVFTLRANLMF